MNTSAEVLFVYIQNPLQPAESRINVTHAHDPERTLADHLGPLEGEWAVSISGKMVEQEDWALSYLSPGDCVVVAPMIYGGGKGGGGKSILRMVALVAVSYFSAGAGTALGFTGATAAAVSIGVGIAGTLAVNALLPVAQPKLPGTGANFNDSPTYGVDGPKNLSTRNIPVPVIYGECWFAGNFIQTYVDNVGDDQYLNMLLCIGEGPIDGISDIQINDQPIANYTGIEVIFRDGSANQALMPYFNDIVRPFSRNVTLGVGTTMQHTVAESVDRLRVDIVLPKGLNHLDEEDGMQGWSTSFRLEIREAGGAWGPFNGSNASIGISAKRMSPIRYSYWSKVLDRNKRYEVRAAHNESDEQENVSNTITVTDINYINFDDINYRHTALLGLRIKLSDQLSGIPSVRYKVRGRKVPVWQPASNSFVEQFTKNPAWHCLDAFMNKRYGGGLRAERFKIEYWKDWADFCATNGLEFNGAIDQRTNLWDATAPIQKLGRGQVVAAGTKYQVAILRQSRPVQLFTTATIKAGSLSIDWLAQDERANEVHVGYFDKNDNGKQRTVIVPNMKARERGEDNKPTEITLYGCDNVTQATREGTLAMNMQELLKTISFQAPIEALVCTLGDVISVQHDMPDWGEGGLTAPGSTKSIVKLDKPIKMTMGGQYVVQVRHDQVIQGTFDIEAVVGKFVVPGFGFNIQNFDRFRRLVNTRTGEDFQINGRGVIDQFGRHGVMLEANPAGKIVVGDVIRFIDTNVIEQRLVIAEDPTVEVTQLRLTTPLSEVPRTETPWALGLNEQVVSQFTVMDINRKDDLWPMIGGLEYRVDAYSDTVIDTKPDPINTSPVIPNVVFNGFKERRYLDGGAYTSDIEMGWDSSDPMYAYAEVHISIDDEPYRLMDANASIYTLEKLNAGKISLKLVPVTIEGFKPAFGLVTVHTYTVAPGVPRVPPAPLNFRFGTLRGDVIELLWGDIDAWSASQNLYAYEVWHAPYENANPNDAQLLAVTRNNHYPHVGLTPESWHTYWLRTSNLAADNVKGPFAGPISTKSGERPPIDYTDLDEDLREAITDASNLDGLADLVSQVDGKLSTLTDDHKQEVFDRKEQVGELTAHVNQTVATLVTADEALASDMTNMEATVGATIAAEINNVKTVIASGDEALALEMGTIGAGLNEEINAAIEIERLARATADAALTQDVERRVSQLNDELRAAISVETQTRVTENSALAQQVRTVSTNVNGFRSAIQEVVEAVDGVKASYSLRIDNNGVISGFGIASGEGGESEFIINATRFKICPPGAAGSVAVSVFEVNTNGAMRIKNAIVGDIQSDNYISGVSGWIIKK